MPPGRSPVSVAAACTGTTPSRARSSAAVCSRGRAAGQDATGGSDRSPQVVLLTYRERAGRACRTRGRAAREACRDAQTFAAIRAKSTVAARGRPARALPPSTCRRRPLEAQQDLLRVWSGMGSRALSRPAAHSSRGLTGLAPKCQVALDDVPLRRDVVAESTTCQRHRGHGPPMICAVKGNSVRASSGNAH